MNVREKLQDRINIELDMDVELPERLYPGHHQRSAGAWVWVARDRTTGEEVGREVPMGECLKAEGLWHIVD